jgi:hypothetical protein
MVDDLAGLLRTYTRAFLSQGVGIVGLAWCLAETLPLASVALTALVIVDQAIFLRGRWRAPDRNAPVHVALNAWCLLVSAADLTLCVGAGLRGLGVQDGAGRPVEDPLSCLAFALASLGHVDLHLAAATGGGRLLVAATGLLGDVALVGALVTAWRLAGPARHD